MIDGLICYKDQAGNCYQNGLNGRGASMVCEKTRTFNIFVISESKSEIVRSQTVFEYG